MDDGPGRPNFRLRARLLDRVASNQVVGGLPRDFWVLWVGVLVNRAGTFVVPFLALYVTEGLGLSPAVAGAALLGFGIGGLPSSPIGGTLADSVGRVKVLGITQFASAAALVWMALATSPWQLVGSATVLGFFSNMGRPASSALIADLIPQPQRARAFGLQFWAINLGFAAAVSVGGVLAEVGWGWLFVGDAITTAVYGVIVMVMVPEPERETSATPDGEAVGSIRTVLSDRLFMAFMGLSLAMALMYSQPMSTLSLEITSHGLTARDYGLILALNGVVIVLVQPFAVARASRWSPGKAMALAFVLVGAGLGLTALAETVTFFAITVVIWTLGEILNATFAATVVADMSPPHMRGRYQGWFGFSWAIAWAIGPALGLRVFDSVGGDIIWITCAVSGGLGAIAMMRLRVGLIERRAMAAVAG